LGEGLDSASGGFADTGIVTESEGYSGFANAGGLSKVGHTEGLHRRRLIKQFNQEGGSLKKHL
jgi:hypothetical protein